MIYILIVSQFKTVIYCLVSYSMLSSESACIFFIQNVPFVLLIVDAELMIVNMWVCMALTCMYIKHFYRGSVLF